MDLMTTPQHRKLVLNCHKRTGKLTENNSGTPAPMTGRRGHSCSRPAQLHQLKLPTGYQTLPSQIPPRRGFNKPHSYYDVATLLFN
uniref:Uncharacterized protein n=1 Tax=Heterorhabditis bacteriophora TaxID=37862 RepID=A0A1I7WVC6_HETBA